MSVTLRPIGASGLMTPPLVFGGNIFGWTADAPTSFALLDHFVARGGTMIDTADVYSRWVPGHKGGESETVIGQWLKASGKRDRVLIATKVGLADGLSRATIIQGVEASLRRLGTDYIDLYYAHKDDADTPQDETLAAFATLIDSGKVRVIGASNFGAMRLKSALDTSKRETLPFYHVVQPEYNLVARHRFEGELQDLCVTHNIGALPYYALASGFLTGKYRSEADTAGKPRAERVATYLDARGLSVLAVMDEIAAETGATLAQVALAWLAAQPGVAAPIASATSLAQLDELIGSWDVVLSAAQLARLTNAGV